MAGHIIFLNGTSSAGKTTLAHALQETLPEFWLHVALDQFRDGMPDRFRGLNASPGETGADGLNVVPVTSEDGTRYTEVRFGETGASMLKGMRRAMRALVESGTNIIIDDIILEPAFLCDYLDVFNGLIVTFVGVRCPADVINAREAARPGRFPGTAVGHLAVCHAHGDYDIEVDTSRQSPIECAALIAGARNRDTNGAFSRIRAR